MNKLTLACATALLTAAMGAQAHHSAAQFDFGNTVDISGTVKFVRFANPHAKVILEVTDEARGTRDIEFEGHSRNNYYRSGLRPGMVEVGDRITLIAAPMRDGSDGGYALGVILEDGTRF